MHRSLNASSRNDSFSRPIARTRQLAAFALFALAVSCLNGCVGQTTSVTLPGGSPSEQKAIVVDGSSTVFRISKAAQEAFSAARPEIQVIVDNHGTGGGFSRYLEGEVDIVDASRAAKPEEESQAKALGLDWTRFVIAYDGISLVVNPENTFVKSLSVDQLKALFTAGSKVKTWKDLNPAWPANQINFYTPDDDSGTYEFFLEAVLGKGGKQREDVQASSDDNILVRGVAGDPNAIGYFGYAYYAGNKAKLRVLGIQEKADAPAIEPTHDTILNKTYVPLARPLYIYVQNNTLKRSNVADFVKYYLENCAALAEKAGYVAPPEAERAANLSALAASPSSAASVAAKAEPKQPDAAKDGR